MAGALFRTKSIDRLMADVAVDRRDDAQADPGSVRRWSRSASARSSARACSSGRRRRSPNGRGPSVTLAFIVAGVGCAFAGLCYAEFASMIPIAGSAYTYSYATMGELIAWIIGWDLILEYAVGAATVAIAWSEYFNRVLEYVGLRVPYEWSPFAVRGGSRRRPARHHQHSGDLHPAGALGCCSSAARRNRRSSTPSSSSPRSRSC